MKRLLRRVAAALAVVVLPLALSACFPVPGVLPVLPVITGVAGFAGFALDHQEGLRGFFADVKGADGAEDKARVAAVYYCRLRDTEPDLADAARAWVREQVADGRIPASVIDKAEGLVTKGCHKLE